MASNHRRVLSGLCAMVTVLNSVLGGCVSVIVSINDAVSSDATAVFNPLPTMPAPMLPDVPNSEASVPLGQRCLDSLNCGVLFCDRSVLGGECNVPCAADAPDHGALACGRVGGVCVSSRDRGANTSHCAPTCNVAVPNSCRMGYACRAQPTLGAQVFACVRVCESDNDCLNPQRCQLPMGQCTAGTMQPTADAGSSADEGGI